MLLDREEYIEQTYFFQTMIERLKENVPMQDSLESIRDEVLATTRLPMAIDFMLGELKHVGGFGSAMRRLSHYFSRFQAFVIEASEDDQSRVDAPVALLVLSRLAEYFSHEATPQGTFLYQFEALSRNRLNYDKGLAAISEDPIYDANWREWILLVRRQIGIVGLAELIYVRSQHYQTQREQREGRELPPEKPILFGEKEGKIALANRQKDPLLLFAAMQRQLGYPIVPRPVRADAAPELLPQLARRMERMEQRVKLLEEEQKGGIDITKFYGKGLPPPEPA